MDSHLSQKKTMQADSLQSAPAPVQQQTVDFLLPRKAVEKLSGLSRATIYRLIKSGKFPRPLSIGTGSVRWRQSEVIAWQQSLNPTHSG
jgi:prophage regulatory protein